MYRWIPVLVSMMVTLGGCQPGKEDGVAVDTTPAALMRAVFPHWKPDAPTTTRIEWQAEDHTGTTRQESGWVLVSPARVIPLAPGRVLLIVAGKPADAEGQSQIFADSQGNIGAYWFEQRGKRWYLDGSRPSAGWNGFYGEIGELNLLPLGNGRQALAIDNGNCWQGQCGHWLSLYALESHRLSPLLIDHMHASDALDASPGCASLMDAPAGSTHHESLENYSTSCHAISSRWEILPRTDAPGDLIIQVTGKTTSAKQVALAPPVSPSESSAPVEGEAEDETPTEEYLVSIHGIKETLIYRFRDGRYQLASGKNPVAGF